MVVPEFPQSKFCCGVVSLPLDVISSVLESKNSALIPRDLNMLRVDMGSLPNEKFLMRDFPLAIEDSITARCEIDLSEGMVIVPLRPVEIF